MNKRTTVCHYSEMFLVLFLVWMIAMGTFKYVLLGLYAGDWQSRFWVTVVPNWVGGLLFIAAWDRLNRAQITEKAISMYCGVPQGLTWLALFVFLLVPFLSELWYDYNTLYNSVLGLLLYVFSLLRSRSDKVVLREEKIVSIAHLFSENDLGRSVFFGEIVVFHLNEGDVILRCSSSATLKMFKGTWLSARVNTVNSRDEVEQIGARVLSAPVEIVPTVGQTVPVTQEKDRSF